MAAGLLALVIGFASWSVLPTPSLGAHILWGVVTLPLWILLFIAYDLYASGLRRVGYATADEIPKLAHAFLVGTVSMWFYFQLVPPGKLVFGELLAFVGTAFVLALVFRWAARILALRQLGVERVLFVGSASDDSDSRSPDALHADRDQRALAGALEPVAQTGR